MGDLPILSLVVFAPDLVPNDLVVTFPEQAPKGAPGLVVKSQADTLPCTTRERLQASRLIP